MEKSKIEVGQIWEVTTDNFLTTENSNKYKRPLKILKGEKIEIRYPYEWHFRTKDSHYLHATPEMIFDNCELFGTIMDTIRMTNKANLEEILRLKLYK